MYKERGMKFYPKVNRDLINPLFFKNITHLKNGGGALLFCQERAEAMDGGQGYRCKGKARRMKMRRAWFDGNGGVIGGRSFM